MFDGVWKRASCVWNFEVWVSNYVTLAGSLPMELGVLGNFASEIAGDRRYFC